MTTMRLNDLSVIFNMPEAPKGEGTHSLPPHCEQEVYKVDEYPSCPLNWQRGGKNASSYFATLTPGHHMWFDFNENLQHTHDVAVVCSIQGINPVTGQHTKSTKLEQYSDKCPIHETEFGAELFCEECGYKWPKQNYLTTANSSIRNGLFWIDGFRAEDNIVRGFLVTEESMKGVAAQLIGEDRVWAVGIAFYLSKKLKPVYESPRLPYMGISGQSVTKDYIVHPGHWAKSTSDSYHWGSVSSSSVMRSMSASSNESVIGVPDTERPKQLEVGAGAKIEQQLDYPDPNDLDYYQEEPAAVIYMNFSDAQTTQKILDAGKRDLTAGGEGFMKDLNVGNA